ncbi:hypothetical protein ACU6U9_06615 [Pseudomonas sp. HK3]|jgi:flagellin-like hook-associated protein FlgL
MWLRSSTALSLALLSQVSLAQPLNFPGDMLATGQQYASTKISMTDHYAGGNYIDDASLKGIENNDRDISDARGKGYGFITELTYMTGLNSDLNLGVRYAYAYEKSESSIDAEAGDNVEGDWVNEGGTELSLLGNMRINHLAIWENEIQLPICSSSSSVCKTRLASPQNSKQTGRSGGQGQGFLALKTGIAANWETEMDTHWMGRAYTSAALSDKVNGEKVSAPISFGASFGSVMPLQLHHQIMGTLSVDYMLSYSAYSTQVQNEVDYGSQSRVSFTVEYLWDVMNQMQVRPFVDVAIVQQPTQTFTLNGQRSRLEYTAGTQVALGAQLSASF